MYRRVRTRGRSGREGESRRLPRLRARDDRMEILYLRRNEAIGATRRNKPYTVDADTSRTFLPASRYASATRLITMLFFLFFFLLCFLFTYAITTSGEKCRGLRSYVDEREIKELEMFIFRRHFFRRPFYPRRIAFVDYQSSQNC